MGLLSFKYKEFRLYYISLFINNFKHYKEIP